jgi:Leucine rich repeat variant
MAGAQSAIATAQKAKSRAVQPEGGAMASTDMRKKFRAKSTFRGSQVIFGERQHLREVLYSLRRSSLPRARKQAEVRKLERLIQARSDELNRINPAWDRKFKKAHNPATTPRELLRLAAALSDSDYLLARVLTEHKNAPGELLTQLSNHPYSAVRENVARHPNTPVEVLREMAADTSDTLWFLVACNPSIPDHLRERLRERMKTMA